MAVLYIVENPSGTTQMYDKVSARALKDGQPPGIIFHTAAMSEGGGLTIVEVWESEEAREKWIKKVDQAIEEFGGPQQPRRIKKYKVHNIRSGSSATK